MSVKVCPKCGTQNQNNKTSCCNCYASLVEVSLSTSKEQPKTSEMEGMENSDLSSIAPIPKRSSAAGGDMFKPQPRYEEKQGQGSLIAVIALVVILLAGAIYALMPRKQVEPAIAADRVVISFLEAKKTGDIQKVMPFLSENSINYLNTFLASRQAKSAGFTRADAHNMLLFDVNPTKKQLEKSQISAQIVEDDLRERNTIMVHVTLTPMEQPHGTTASQSIHSNQQATFAIDEFVFGETELDYVLIIEADEWKVDLKKTRLAAPSKNPINTMLR